MFGAVNPRQMQGMMKKMGISQEEIPAEKVIIEKTPIITVIVVINGYNIPYRKPCFDL